MQKAFSWYFMPVLFCCIPVSYGIQGIDFSTHAMQSIYILLELFVSATPIRLAHFFHGVLFLAAFMVFSIGWTFVKDEPIYPVLPWKTEPGTAIVVSLGMMVMPFFITIFLFALYRMRLAMCACACCGKQDPDTVEPTTESRDELHAHFRYWNDWYLKFNSMDMM